MKKIVSLIFMTVLLLVINSCQKEFIDEIYQLSDSETRFLNSGSMKSGDNEKKQGFVLKIINDIDRQNKEKGLSTILLKNMAIPTGKWFDGSKIMKKRLRKFLFFVTTVVKLKL